MKIKFDRKIVFAVVAIVSYFIFLWAQDAHHTWLTWSSLIVLLVSAANSREYVFIVATFPVWGFFSCITLLTKTVRTIVSSINTKLRRYRSIDSRINFASANKYAVIIGSDRLANDSDIQELSLMGLLGTAKKALTLHVNMGPYKEILRQASIVNYPKQFVQKAIEEWKVKGFSVPVSSVMFRHHSFADGALFVVATICTKSKK